VTITFITPVADTGKRILLEIGKGDGKAMGSRGCARLRQMKGPGAKFGRKQEEATPRCSRSETSIRLRTTGVAPNTLLKWTEVPEFDAAYREARRAAFGQRVAQLQQGTSAAATTLLKTMIDPNTSVPTVFGPSSLGVERAPNESLAETPARAMGISIRDLRAKLWVLAGSVATDIRG
jgi:hypothetical protein